MSSRRAVAPAFAIADHDKTIASRRILLLAALVALAGSARAIQATTLVSRDASGASAQDACYAAAMTPDGRFVAMLSRSTDLDPTIPPLGPMPTQVWLRDRWTGTNELVSVSMAGGYANGGSDAVVFGADPVALSSDGRFVAFESRATDLVAGDTNGGTDVFVRDLASGTTTRASVGWNGAQAISAFTPRISNDGRYVLFASETDLAPGAQGGAVEKCYRRDLVLQTTETITSYTSGTQHDLSGDGTIVAFCTALQLLPVDTNANMDVYVKDLTTGALTIESVGLGGALANASSFQPKLSQDGGVVAFRSAATNLVAGDTNGVSDIFVRERASGTTTVATRSTSGALVGPHGTIGHFRLSADGAHVAFSSNATNLIEADMNGNSDAFVHDRISAETQVFSVDSNGEQTSGIVEGLSADGQLVLFHSEASATPDDVPGNSVFLHDRSIVVPRAFCFGTAAACPCGNAGPTGHGCANHSGTLGARLRSIGTSSVASDDYLLVGSLLTANSPALIFQGTSRVNGGQGVVFGDGLRCVGGAVLRIGVRVADSSGSVAFGAPLGDTPISVRGQVPAAGGTFHYQAWYRDAVDWCTPSTFNLSTGLSVTWVP
jgi:Tol biopolymer transport system component